VQKIIGVTELQRRFRSVFDEVVHQGVPYILARGSRPEAALIPYDQFLRYQRLDRQGMYDLLDQLQARAPARRAPLSEEEVAADVAAAIKEVRSGRRSAQR